MEKGTDELNVSFEIGLKCQYLIKMKEIVIEGIGKRTKIVIIMEYCKGGSLADRIKKNPHFTDAVCFCLFVLFIDHVIVLY